MRDTSQDASVRGEWLRRFPILAALKGLANGVSPRWGTKTVVVSYVTGDILRVESRAKGRAKEHLNGKRQQSKRARIFL